MDKDLSKKLFRVARVRTADWLMAPASIDDVLRTRPEHARSLRPTCCQAIATAAR